MNLYWLQTNPARPRTMAVQLCYNRGCGKEYNIRENTEDSCSFHHGRLTKDEVSLIIKLSYQII